MIILSQICTKCGTMQPHFVDKEYVNCKTCKKKYKHGIKRKSN